MQLSAYDLYTSNDSLTYEFDSVSPARTIRKVITYDPFPDNPQVFNLSLGDKLADGTVNDLVRSNNDDLEKVMATVAKTLLAFFSRYPDCLVYFKGSTDSRTRLFLHRNLSKLSNGLSLRELHRMVLKNLPSISLIKHSFCV